MINKLLIHTCCADCFLNAFDSLKENKQINDDSQITLYYFNPNIHPRSEFVERLNALKKVLLEINNKNIKLVVPDYKPQQYFEKISSTNKRCVSCWELRLRGAFEYARINDIKDLSSTLLTSQYQDSEKIIEIANTLSKEFDINFVYSECECKTHKGFYKQNYCGCCYSLLERYAEKYISK